MLEHNGNPETKKERRQRRAKERAAFTAMKKDKEATAALPEFENNDPSAWGHE